MYLVTQILETYFSWSLCVYMYTFIKQRIYPMLEACQCNRMYGCFSDPKNYYLGWIYPVLDVLVYA